MKPLLVFRADGNARMGLGHVVRSLALADMLGETYDRLFLSRAPSPGLCQQIEQNGCRLVDIAHIAPERETDFLLQHFLSGREIVLLDGYHFDTAYQQRIKAKGNPLVCIDDIHPHSFIADAVVNHAPGIHPKDYSIAVHTQLFLGLDYSLLRRPFRQAAQSKRQINEIQKIFICFGGADPFNLSLKTLYSIAGQVTDITSIDLVLGSAHGQEKSIRDFAASCKESIHIHQGLDAEQMVQLMQQNHLAIVPASSILHEVTAVRMPVISGYYVDNQEKVYHGFRKLGMIYGVGNFLEFNDYPMAIAAVRSRSAEDFIAQQQKHQSGQAARHFSTILDQLAANANTGGLSQNNSVKCKV